MKLARPTAEKHEPGARRPNEGEFQQRLKFRAYEATLAELEAKHLSADVISQAMLENEIASAVEMVLAIEGVTLGITQRSKLIEEIAYELTGLGPIQPYLDDPSIDDIVVNGFDTIYIERNGELEERSSRFRDDAHLMNIIQRIVGPVGRRVDESSPYVDARLADGTRVNVIIPPVSLNGPVLSIRKFREQPLKPKDLIRLQTVSREMLTYLASAVRARLNILICGGTGSGKTTLLNALSAFIGPKERLVTIEDTAELRLQQRHVVRLETRPRSPDSPAAEVTARDLMRNVLRMRPDRIVLGEVRGVEAVDMLQAMGTGHNGSMTTMHANGVRDALDRLEILMSLGETRTDARTFRRYIANVVHVVVHAMRAPGGRRVHSVAEVAGLEGDTYTLHELFRFSDGGPAGGGHFEQVSPRSQYLPRLDPNDLDALMP
ncbi:MAG TPA: CpaF family protein [Rhizomicrobium sp.]|nr:CpaF family protein [Rhizomicrobium sp.]